MRSHTVAVRSVTATTVRAGTFPPLPSGPAAPIRADPIPASSCPFAPLLSISATTLQSSSVLFGTSRCAPFRFCHSPTFLSSPVHFATFRFCHSIPIHSDSAATLRYDPILADPVLDNPYRFCPAVPLQYAALPSPTGQAFPILPYRVVPNPSGPVRYCH